MLTREPADVYEREVVNGFAEVRQIESIWVRHLPPQVTGSYPIRRHYLAFSIFEPDSLRLTDRIEEAFTARHIWARIDFEFERVACTMPIPGAPACIWRRRLT